MTRTKLFFHVDMDAFFASVEQRDDPDLKGKPVIVGAAPGNRGVVSTCSYEARKYGVHSAMPVSEAFSRCPTGVFMPVRMERYCEVSARLRTVFESMTSDVQMVSIDEAFLDMTGTEKLWGDASAAASLLKKRVADETGLTITVGAATNRYVAKIASSVYKPDGCTIVPPGGEAAFMTGIPLEKLWGAGEVTQRRFRELGIRTVSQLCSLGESTLVGMLGSAAGAFFYRVARGMDPGIFERKSPTRSMSTETTFERDVSDAQTVTTTLLELSEQLMHRLLAEGKRSRAVSLKLRLDDFSTTTSRRKLDRCFVSADGIADEVRKLLERQWDGARAIRLVGIALEDLEEGDSPEQGDLFDSGSARKKRIERAIYDLGRRGVGKVTRARLVRKKEGT